MNWPNRIRWQCESEMQDAFCAMTLPKNRARAERIRALEICSRPIISKAVTMIIAAYGAWHTYAHLQHSHLCIDAAAVPAAVAASAGSAAATASCTLQLLLLLLLFILNYMQQLLCVGSCNGQWAGQLNRWTTVQLDRWADGRLGGWAAGRAQRVASFAWAALSARARINLQFSSKCILILALCCQLHRLIRFLVIIH